MSNRRNLISKTNLKDLTAKSFCNHKLNPIFQLYLQCENVKLRYFDRYNVKKLT